MAKRGTPKTTDKPRLAVGVLRPQSHGGALRNGGTNRGGPGRPPEAIRIKSREVFAKWLEWADAQLDDKKTEDDLRMQIANTVLKVGFKSEGGVTPEEIRERLTKQLDAINAALPPDEAAKVIAIIRPAWAA